VLVVSAPPFDSYPKEGGLDHINFGYEQSSNLRYFPPNWLIVHIKLVLELTCQDYEASSENIQKFIR